MNFSEIFSLNVILYSVFAYFIGSIPTAYIVGRFKNIDIRQFGSGNVGATNTFRIFGPKAGVLVLLIDIAKGYVPVFLAQRWTQVNESQIYSLFFIGACAVIGHMFPLWLRFRGGKGVATAGGIMLAISPPLMIIGLIIFFIFLSTTHMVSLSSILSVASLLISFFIFFDFEKNEPFFFFLLSLAITVVIKHRSNIKRILNGTESKIGSFAR